MKDDEKEIIMVENEDGEYIAEDEIKKPVIKEVNKVRIKRPINYAYAVKSKQHKPDFEEQFIGGFKVGLSIVKKVNNYLKELK